jgi:O-antigen/teichoic acid export membrane protein
MNSVRRSLYHLLVNNYYTIALQLIGTMIISRLLTPAEVGIYAVAAVLVAVASQLRDFGLQEYIIQAKDLSKSRIRAAFGMNILTSWSMACLFLVSSKAVGDFYHQPGISEIMRIQAINLCLVPFGAINMAYFRRELNYRPNLVAGTFSSTLSFVVATTLAFNGFGYMSLAWSAFSGVVSSVTISLYFRPADFPRWPSFKGIGEVFHFSKYAMSIYAFGQISKSAPEAVVGRVEDTTAVAYLSRANGMIEVFNRLVISPAIEICLPAFSKASHSGDGTRWGYLRATTLLTGIGWPFFIAMALLSYSAIRLLYGPQWGASVPLAQILCFVPVVQLVYWLAGEVMIAVGRIDQSNRLQIINVSLRLASLLLIFPYGLSGVCWGLLGAALIGTVVSHHFLHHVIELRFRDVMIACKPSLYTAALSSLPAIVLTTLFTQDEGNYFVMLLATGLLTVVFWLAAIKLFAHPLWSELNLLANNISKKFRGIAR